MANKFDGDVRPLSNDKRYMHTVFDNPVTGLIQEAINQSKMATDHGVAPLSAHGKRLVTKGMSRDRIALLQHLNLAPL